MEWSHCFGFLTSVEHCRKARHSPPELGNKEKMRATVVQKHFIRHFPKVSKTSYAVSPPKRFTISQEVVKSWDFKSLIQGSLGNTDSNIARSTPVF